MIRLKVIKNFFHSLLSIIFSHFSLLKFFIINIFLLVYIWILCASYVSNKIFVIFCFKSW